MSNPFNLDDLKTLAAGLPEVSNYFKGSQLSSPLPNNVLCFFRSALPRDPGQGSSHHRHIMIFNLACEGGVILDGQLFQLSALQGIVICPYQFHNYEQAHVKGMHWVFVSFDLDEALPVPAHPVFVITDIMLYHLHELLAHHTKPKYTTPLCQLLLNAIHFRPQPTTLSDPLTEEVVRWVYNHLKTPFHVRDIAEAVHVSESYLRAHFKQRMGASLGRHVRLARLHRAQVRLETSVESVATIASQCGFSSLYAFSRTFKQEYGLSPLQWRKQHGDSSSPPA